MNDLPDQGERWEINELMSKEDSKGNLNTILAVNYMMILNGYMNRLTFSKIGMIIK